jgi:hypothetical protein
MPDSFIDDPKYWRDRAAEALGHVEKIYDYQAQLLMLRIVRQYERLARYAESHKLSAPGRSK